MPAGQERGEPTVEIAIDQTNKWATVTIGNLIPKHQEPKVQIHFAKEGQSPAIHITGALAKSEPTAEWTMDETGAPESIVVSGICLARCLDEPGRMSPDDVLHHVMSTAVVALRDHMEAIRIPQEELADRKAKLIAEIEKKQLVRPVVKDAQLGPKISRTA